MKLKPADHRFRFLPCGHLVRLGHTRRVLELLGLMPCSECISACGDHQAWLDERADDEERRQSL